MKVSGSHYLHKADCELYFEIIDLQKPHLSFTFNRLKKIKKQSSDQSFSIFDS